MRPGVGQVGYLAGLPWHHAEGMGMEGRTQQSCFCRSRNVAETWPGTDVGTPWARSRVLEALQAGTTQTGQLPPRETIPGNVLVLLGTHTFPGWKLAQGQPGGRWRLRSSKGPGCNRRAT